MMVDSSLAVSALTVPDAAGAVSPAGAHAPDDVHTYLYQAGVVQTARRRLLEERAAQARARAEADRLLACTFQPNVRSGPKQSRRRVCPTAAAPRPALRGSMFRSDDDAPALFALHRPAQRSPAARGVTARLVCDAASRRRRHEEAQRLKEEEAQLQLEDRARGPRSRTAQRPRPYYAKYPGGLYQRALSPDPVVHSECTFQPSCHVDAEVDAMCRRAEARRLKRLEAEQAAEQSPAVESRHVDSMAVTARLAVPRSRARATRRGSPTAGRPQLPAAIYTVPEDDVLTLAELVG